MSRHVALVPALLLGLGLLRSSAESVGLADRLFIRETAFNGPSDPYVLLGFGLAFVCISIVGFATTSR